MELDIFSGLEGLVEHSLLRQDEQPGGEPRFFMLETVREFGLERLDERGEAEAVAARHANYFTTWVETDEPEARGPRQVEWLAQMEVEQDNLRTALGWTLRHDPESALRLASAQHWYWFLRGQVREGRAWLERALAAASNSEERRIMALNWASFLAWNQGDLGSPARGQKKPFRWRPRTGTSEAEVGRYSTSVRSLARRGIMSERQSSQGRRATSSANRENAGEVPLPPMALAWGRVQPAGSTRPDGCLSRHWWRLRRSGTVPSVASCARCLGNSIRAG